MGGDLGRKLKFRVISLLLVSGLFADAIVTETTRGLNIVDLQKTERPVMPDHTLFWIDTPFPYPEHYRPAVQYSDSLTPHKAIVLENQFMEHIQFPEYGGHVLTFRDKLTNKDIYRCLQNPGVLNYFFITKGSHIFFPGPEHGFNSLQPWPYRLEQSTSGAASIFVCKDPLSGMQMTWKTYMPNNGYYIDLTLTVENTSNRSQRAMMWSLQQLPKYPDLRVNFPASIVNVHTGFHLKSSKRAAWQYIDRNTPVPYPIHDDVDIGWSENFPIFHGIYANKIERNWISAHSVSLQQGFAKIISSSTKGVKYYSDMRMIEIFTGITKNLSSYRSFAPGEKTILQERVIPSNAMTWVSGVNKYGITGVYRNKGIQCFEYLLADMDSLKYDSLNFKIKRAGKIVLDSSVAKKVGLVFNKSLQWENEPVGIRIKCGNLKIYDSTFSPTNIMDLTRRLSGEEVVDKNTIKYKNITANIDTSAIQNVNISPVKAISKRTTLMDFEIPEKRISDKFPRLDKITSSARIGNKVFVLKPEEVRVYIDTTKRKQDEVGIFCNSTNAERINPSVSFQAYFNRNPGMFWAPDIIAFQNGAVFTGNKNIYRTDSIGKLVDSISLGNYGAGIAIVDSNRIIVALPFACAFQEVNLATKEMKVIQLDSTKFCYPWSITKTNVGWAVSSGANKRIALLRKNYTLESTFLIPSNPLRTQFKGISAIAWNPKSKRLLISDMDNLNIKLYDLKGTFFGDFTKGGLQDSTTLCVRDITYDSDEKVTITQFYNRTHSSAQVKVFSENGKFLGSIGIHHSTDRSSANRFFSPMNGDTLLGYDEVMHEINLIDGNDSRIKSFGAKGWGRGLDIYPCGVAYNKSAGLFIADVEKWVVNHYDANLNFIEEITSKPNSPLFAPTGCVIDKSLNLHVIESNTNSINIFKRLANGKYSFMTSYKLPDTFGCVQNIYCQFDKVVVADINNNRLYRFTSMGKFIDSIKTPDSLFVTDVYTCNKEKSLMIACKDRPFILKVLYDSAKIELSQIEYQGSYTAIVDTKIHELFLKSKRPADTRYVLIRPDLGKIFLDSLLQITPKESDHEGTPIRKVTGLSYRNNTIVMTKPGFNGFVLQDLKGGKPKHVKILLTARAFTMVRWKNDTTICGFTNGPDLYYEATTSGKLLQYFGAQTDDFLGFSRSGELFFVNYRTGRLSTHSSKGNRISQTSIQVPQKIFNMQAVARVIEGPDQNLYYLEYEHGRILRLDKNDSVKVVFSGLIGKGETHIAHASWFDFLDTNRIVITEFGSGKMHIVDLNNNYYGGFNLDSKERFAWDIDYCQVVNRNRILFYGKNGIQQVDLEYKK